MRSRGTVPSVRSLWRRAALLGGPAFLVVWFSGANIEYFALGGGDPLTRTEADFVTVAVANAAEFRLAATMLVVAAGLLLFFGSALLSDVETSHGLARAASAGSVAIAVLLALQAALIFTSVELAAEAAQAFLVYRLSGAVGFESFPVSLLAAVTLFAASIALGKPSIPPWLWWTTIAMATVLAVGGILEGLGIVPDGRFAIFFGLWATITGLTLAFRPPDSGSISADQSPSASAG